MKYFIIILIFVSSQLFSQNNSFYKALSSDGELKFYSQINKTPVIISNGNLLIENSLPNYTKGLQFMQAPGLFSSVNELYTYLTNNSKFYFSNNSEKGSYYNKNATHNAQRQMYYNGGVEIYNKSLSLNDEEASKDPLWDLISNVRFQLIFRETYIKDNNYEFLLLSTVNVFKAEMNINSTIDIDKTANYFLKNSSTEDIKRFKKSVGSYCMIKEDGIWKACSAEAVFKYLQEKGFLQLIKNKVDSNNFYDVLSVLDNGIRTYNQI